MKWRLSCAIERAFVLRGRQVRRVVAGSILCGHHALKRLDHFRIEVFAALERI
jgi:hypothetical protein